MKQFVKIDQFGQKVNLLINKEDQHQTILGALLSLAIFGIVFQTFLSLVNDLFQRNNPQLVTNSQTSESPEEFMISWNKYFFGLAVVDVNGIPILQFDNNTFFTTQVEIYTRKYENKNGYPSYVLNSIELPLVRCIDADVDPYMLESLQFSQEVLKLIYCVKKSDWETYKPLLKGSQSSSVLSALIFTLKICNQSTIPTGMTCASQQNIDKFFQSAYAAMLYSDRNIIQQGKGNPYQPKRRSYSSKISNQYHKTSNFFMMHTTTQTTENFVYFNPTVQKYHEIQYSTNVEQIDPSNGDGELMRINILLDEKSINYLRSYNTILDILGNTSGLLNLLIFFGSLIMTPLNKLSLWIQLIESQFRLKLKRESNEACSLVQPTYFQTQLSSEKLYSSLQSLIKGERLTLKDKLTFYMNPGLLQQFKIGQEKIEKKLNATFILKKLNEVDILKEILFNTDQLRIFKYLPKQEIYDKKKDFLEIDSATNKKEEFKSYEQKIKLDIESYGRMKNQFNSDSKNEALLRMVQEEVKFFFDRSSKQAIPESKKIEDIQNCSKSQQQDSSLIMDLDALIYE